MDQKDIKELIKLIDKSSISEFKVQNGDFKISIKTGNAGEPVIYQAPVAVQQPMVAAAPTPATPVAPANTPAETAAEKPATEEASGVEFKSPMIGTFYRKPSPDKDVFVKVGDKVSKGDIICVIEAMKLFNEIECEMDGTIVKVLADDASPVEYDQPLFLIDPA